MKKTLIFAGLLAIGFAKAQEGKVGINTETPQATLEVQPNAANLRGTTNEGIIAPKLSKERIAAIATPIEGTLVYATDTTYTGTNAKVTKIDAKGYYFYNGTEWVKINTKAYTGSTSVELNGDSFERTALTGDVTAAKNNNEVTVTGLRGRQIATTAPTSGSVLQWTGTAWNPVMMKIYSASNIYGDTLNAPLTGVFYLLPEGSITGTDTGRIIYHGAVHLLHVSETPYPIDNFYHDLNGDNELLRAGRSVMEHLPTLNLEILSVRSVRFEVPGLNYDAEQATRIQVSGRGNLLNSLYTLLIGGNRPSDIEATRVYEISYSLNNRRLYALARINTAWAMRIK